MNDIDSMQKSGLRIFGVQFLLGRADGTEVAFRFDHAGKEASFRFLQRPSDQANGVVEFVAQFILGELMNTIGGMKQFGNAV
ncbi:hypothetical protein NIBR502774_18895 (plasmid) [Rhizobium sp. NIBRBAC000502774]|nr:hypothetical protein NIBR502774_18895 [Rhizobium sp. NIBRBAC000502774]